MAVTACMAMTLAPTSSPHRYAQLAAKLSAYVGDARVRWVRGYYSASLTRHLATERQMAPALYVDLDCDLYSSTATALEWLVMSRLIVPGTILGYDDWTTGGEGGQQRAHAEMVRKHGLVVRRLEGRGAAREPCFEVVAIRGAGVEASDLKSLRVDGIRS